ncbi:MAG TPA: Fe-S protein assembly chaperone HscA [Chitinophagaceae bacterium]|nr:Fe-S protein assembly chaperone HscA [Chitinophagaceae bacterium]
MAKISINLATGSIQQDEVIVGIDLGTTNSLVSIIHPETKKPMVLKDIDNTTLVPSVIHIGADGNITVGQAAKKYLETDAAHTIYSVKRLMGKSYNDVKNTQNFSYKIIDNNTESLVKIQVGNQFYTPTELSSLILKELKQRAEHVLKMEITKCVITVPAYFNDTQRQATRDAGKLAGLEVLRIVNEPTAASLAYGIGLQEEASKNIAVYDLGGGTFDISVLKMTGGIFDVLSTNGDTYLGGDDFDQLIMQHFMTQLHWTTEFLQQHKELSQTIRLTAEEAKKQLSTSDYFESQVNNEKVFISKKEFEILIEQLVAKTIVCCGQALKDSGLEKKDIAGVVMVGGSTRIPLIKQSVQTFFDCELYDQVNPDEVVAMGAAIQADILAGNNTDTLLLDVTPLSLGIETMGGLMDVLIPRNNKIPCKASRQYTTQKDGQTGIIVSVYQGERDLVSDNRKLASFTLQGIPAMPAGLPKVAIQFVINADGILQVSATELRSGVAQQIEVKPQYGLTDSEVESRLLASITHAKEDIQTRSLIEAITEASTMLQLTENFLFKHNVHITTEEQQATQLAIAQLQQAIDEKNKDRILAATEQLNAVSSPYAERVMDIAVAEALKGKGV